MSTADATPNYESVNYRRLGRSGLLVPPISLGLWQNFGRDRDFERQKAIILRAFDLGVTHFDLANNYGPPPGAAEETFSWVLHSDLAAHRDEIVVSSKAGFPMWRGPYGDGGGRKYVLASLDQSLKRLGVDYIDIFYSHRRDSDTPLAETMSALATAVRSGKALYVGLSNYSDADTKVAAAILQEERVPLVAHQPRYSIFDRTAEGGLFKTLRELSLGAAIYSPLAQGLLSDRYLDGQIPEGSRASAEHFLRSSDALGAPREIAIVLSRLAKKREQTLAQMALSWALRDPVVATAIIGASSVEQLEQNLRAAETLKFTPDELAAIDAVAAPGTRID